MVFVTGRTLVVFKRWLSKAEEKSEWSGFKTGEETEGTGPDNPRRLS